MWYHSSISSLMQINICTPSRTYLNPLQSMILTLKWAMRSTGYIFFSFLGGTWNNFYSNTIIIIIVEVVWSMGIELLASIFLCLFCQFILNPTWAWTFKKVEHRHILILLFSAKKSNATISINCERRFDMLKRKLSHMLFEHFDSILKYVYPPERHC